MFRIRMICLVLCLLLTGGLAMPAFAAMTDRLPAQQDRQTAPVYYRARSGATVIGRMEDGVQLEAVEKVGNYFRIDCNGMQGYLSADRVNQVDEKYYVNCQEDDASLPGRSGDLTALQAELLALAKQQLGVRYRYGGTSPSGFDCSGFVQYCYRDLGYALHRGATGQLSDGLVVAEGDLQPGDLVFFHGTSWESSIASHVGIYVGDDRFIHASNRGIEIADLYGGYYEGKLIGARRVILSGVAEYTSAPAVARSRGLCPYNGAVQFIAD